jgi:ATP-dependent exoDNAse (exonuclease V) beta subunit
MWHLFSKILKSELDISVEKAGYIISGKIDLLLFKDDQYEIIDFKTEKNLISRMIIPFTNIINNFTPMHIF